jgi:diacylglycerol kinase family enzyme
VVQAAHAAGCAMGVVPRGTFNYFARSHGIHSDVGQAVQQLLQAEPQPVRVAALNGHIFLVNASLGLYPELLEDRERYKARFGRSRWVAVGAGIATLLRAQRRLRLHIELGEGARDVRALTIFVGHNRLQLEQLGVQGDADTRDTPGLPSTAQAPAEGEHLTAVMLRPIGTLALLGLLWHGAMGTLGEAKSVERFEFDHMVVRPSRLYRARRVKVAFDGEVTWMRPPLDFRVLARPLWLLKPVAAG